MREEADSGIGEQQPLSDVDPVVGSILEGTVLPNAPTTNKNILDKLRERDKPLLASGEPAHGPG
jgi:hypothetical protein